MYPFGLVVATGLLCLSGQIALQAQTTQSPQELLKEAVTFHQQGKLEDAIRDYEQFLDVYPEAPEVRSNLGAALAATGKYAQAIEQYKLALMKKSDPKLQLNLALAYYKTDDFADAIVAFEKVRERGPGQPAGQNPPGGLLRAHWRKQESHRSTLAGVQPAIPPTWR